MSDEKKLKKLSPRGGGRSRQVDHSVSKVNVILFVFVIVENLHSLRVFSV